MPDEITYGSMMDSLCKQGRSKGAHKLLDLMVGRGIKPGAVSFRILLLGYVAEGTINDVMNILDDMVLKHGAPDY